nr:S24/S26 family peptidase [Serinicoccus sediminis]
MPPPRNRPRRLGLARVVGSSMEPTLRAGDTVLVLHGGSPRVGAVVVVTLPPDRAGAPRPVAVKRLTSLRGDGALWVRSDGAGTDSRQLGHLAPDALVAVALLRLPRLRPLRGPRRLRRAARAAQR